MSKLITPTIGRVVWYWPSQHETDAGSLHYSDRNQPLPALVAYVHSDRLVNLGGFDQCGRPFHRTSVQLLQEDDDRPHTSEGPFAEWMPYQRAQHKKQAAETKVYTDGASATGVAPLPDQSPAQQDAEALDPSNVALAAEAARQLDAAPEEPAQA